RPTGRCSSRSLSVAGTEGMANRSIFTGCLLFGRSAEALLDPGYDLLERRLLPAAVAHSFRAVAEMIAWHGVMLLVRGRRCLRDRVGVVVEDGVVPCIGDHQRRNHDPRDAIECRCAGRETRPGGQPRPRGLILPEAGLEIVEHVGSWREERPDGPLRRPEREVRVGGMRLGTMHGEVTSEKGASLDALLVCKGQGVKV